MAGEEVFTSRYLYLSLHSMKGCTLTMTCSFPNQPEIQQMLKPGASGASQQMMQSMKKDLMSKFKSEIEEKILEIENNLGGQREYFDYLA
mmetsp:Transcript_11443/g.17237  ORF Transcript_11443/g.17237 Transcript_11443/m.17237 type:complete len:90 (+) Transcript_11443:2145-2414(+)